MKKIVVLFLMTISHLIGFSQNYFDGTLTFKIIENGTPLTYDNFLENWIIVDEQDCIQMFHDDTASRNGDYFELIKDKRNFLKYSDSLGTFSINLGRSSPYFSFQFVNRLDTICHFSLNTGDFHCDSIYADLERYYFSPAQYIEGSIKHPKKSVLLDMEGIVIDLNLLKSKGVLREKGDFDD